MKIYDKIPDKFAVLGTIALLCLFIYSSGDMMWAAALASLSAFYLGFIFGRNDKSNG